MGTSTPSDDTAAGGTTAPGGLPPTDEQLWWSVRETVRSVLLPATVMELDRRIWWPSRLAHADRPSEPREEDPAGA